MNYGIEIYLKEILQELFNSWSVLQNTPKPEVGGNSLRYGANYSLQQCLKAVPIFYDAYFQFPAYDASSECVEDLSTSVREICNSIKAMPKTKSKKQGELNVKEMDRLAALWSKYNV